jgi:hypothetical protein
VPEPVAAEPVLPELPEPSVLEPDEPDELPSPALLPEPVVPLSRTIFVAVSQHWVEAPCVVLLPDCAVANPTLERTKAVATVSFPSIIVSST